MLSRRIGDLSTATVGIPMSHISHEESLGVRTEHNHIPSIGHWRCRWVTYYGKVLNFRCGAEGDGFIAWLSHLAGHSPSVWTETERLALVADYLTRNRA